jgi:hypothetical protein
VTVSPPDSCLGDPCFQSEPRTSLFCLHLILGNPSPVSVVATPGSVRPEYHGSIPGDRGFSHRHCFRIGSGDQNVSCPKDAGGSFPRGKSDGCVKLISSILCQRLRRNGAIPSLPHTSLWLAAQVVSSGATLPLPLPLLRSRL